MITEKTFQLKSRIAKPEQKFETFAVFESRPKDAPVKGGIIVIQEIFGVNHHIKNVARRYAELGYLAWAPSYFDHVEKGVELSYAPESYAKGRELATATGWDIAVEDTVVCARHMKDQMKQEGRTDFPVGAVGYCWGGSVVWLTATRDQTNSLAAGSSYYGSAALTFKTETPQIPLIMHFGLLDVHIPQEGVSALAAHHPTVPVYTYDADHGFNCDEKPIYNANAAKLAQERTLNLFSQHRF